MRGNIDASLRIKAGDNTVVLARGWIEFGPDDPDTVEVWVGVGQGKNAATGSGVYGSGWLTVARPAAGSSPKTTWQCDAETDDPPGYKPGQGDAGAVVIGDTIDPYPWGRDVTLKN
jgi:hypothetical protein